MRLRRLDLTRYGKFTDKVLDFGERSVGRPDFHIVYGPNEAGKSTAFDAYLSLLFGIERSSSYGFQHDYKAMLIGGCIETDGRVLDLLRTKGTVNDLRTTNGDILPAGALGQTLGSLTRASYRAMFSLDNVSLEDGGKAILESKGELGTMLFAASSGLSNVSQQLSAVRDTADTLYKLRGRKTKMHELLEKLGVLNEQHKAIDIAASRFVELQCDVEEARIQHETEVKAREARDKDLRVLRRTASALPLVHRRQALQTELVPIADFPAVPIGWLDAVNQFATDEAAHLSRLQQTDQAIARLENELETIDLNHTLLAMVETISGLGELKARYTTAVLDLPKRISALAEEQTHLTAHLAKLGYSNPATLKSLDPASLLIDVQTIARLTQLANARAAFVADAFAAEEEVRRAVEKCDELDSENALHSSKGSLSFDETYQSMDTQPLQSLMSRIVRDNRSGKRDLLLEELNAKNENLKTIEKALAVHFQKSVDLTLLAAPSVASIERLAAEFKNASNDVKALASSHYDKQAQAAGLKARASVLKTQASITDDDAMLALAELRSKAWEKHAAAIEPKVPNQSELATSAQQYGELAYAEREALIANQRHSEKLGEWRAANVALAEAEAALEIAEVRMLEAGDTQKAIRQIIDRALAQCNLPTIMHPDDFCGWLKNHESMLLVSASITRKQQQVDILESQLQCDREDLLQSLSAWSISCAANAPLDAVVEQAQRALTDAATTNEKRDGAARLREKLQRDLKLREEKYAAAQQALLNWQEHWTSTLSKTWIIKKSSEIESEHATVEAVRAVLDVLILLSQTIDTMSKLSHQIESMKHDQTAYAQSLQQTCLRADFAFDAANPLTSATALESSLMQEREKQSVRMSKQRAAQEARTHRQALEDDMADFIKRRDQMLLHYDVLDISGLRQALNKASRAKELRFEIGTLETQIMTSLRVADLAAALEQTNEADADVVDADIQHLEGEQVLSNESIQTLHHNRLIAEAALAAITSNDKAARLLEERRTVGLEIEQTGLRYLRLRIGADAVESALRTYRDQHRSSMMQDAALRFQRMTDGSFTDLKTQLTDKGESLLAVQANGRSLLPEAMSKGTRDQLFLALRMAGYLEFAKNQSALPFVADDIMETFDNTRAAATFAMLEEVSHHGQVIYLTHHEHLCEIARSVCGDAVRITQL